MTVLGPTDRDAIVGLVTAQLRQEDLFMEPGDVTVVRTDSDHGFDAYVITGLIEANRFDVFIIYFEDSHGEGSRITVMQIPETGDPAWISKSIMTEVLT